MKLPSRRWLRMPWRQPTAAELANVYVMATLVGVFTGIVAAAFHLILDHAHSGRDLLLTLLQDAPVPGWLLVMLSGAVMVTLSLWMVRRFAPEAAGSGIPQVEGTLAGLMKLSWRRVLPVKFVAGTLSIGSGLVLGREGPSIHMGAALGKMLSDLGKLGKHNTKILIASGAGAGLAAAFNAPLAAMLFVTEEMREEFDYSFVSLQSVMLASCIAVVVNDWWLGQGPVLPLYHTSLAPLTELPLYLLLGITVGLMGVLFNRMLLGSVAFFSRLCQSHWILVGIGVGATVGALVWFLPRTVSGGEHLVHRLLSGDWSLLVIMSLLALRTFTTVASYGCGVAGGIFAPMLALGTLCGVAFGSVVSQWHPGIDSTPEMFAVAAMGALFAATVRAPLTGIVLVAELTSAYDSILIIALTCLSATFTAEALGGRPVYRLLLERVLTGHPTSPPKSIEASVTKR